MPSRGDIISTVHWVRLKSTRLRAACRGLPLPAPGPAPVVPSDRQGSQEKATFLRSGRWGQHHLSAQPLGWPQAEAIQARGSLFSLKCSNHQSIKLYLSRPSWATMQKCVEESQWRTGRGNKNKHEKACAMWSSTEVTATSSLAKCN